MRIYDNSFIKEFLYGTMMFMRKNKYIINFYYLLDDLGIRITISKLLNFINNKKHFKQPTNEMIYSKDYYIKNKKNINKVLSLLSDLKSIKTYSCMIDFRSSFDIKKLPYNNYNKQYWFTEYFKYNENEIMIDCGAFDGDSIRSFKKAMQKYNISRYKIIAFEPVKELYELIINNHKDITCINSGVGKENKKKLFHYQNYGGSFFVEDFSNFQETNNFSYVDIKRLDETKECKDATIIKMDIEGAEYEALLGAEKLIKRNKPKLAICIYHKDEDFIRIPLLIHEWVPEYKLYVMQHSNTIYETVLYATL